MLAQLSHREARNLFLAALDESLVEREEARFRAHLDGCGECRQGFVRYSDTVGALRRVEREKAPPSLATMVNRRLRRRRLFGARDLHLAHQYYRVPIEAVIPILIGVLVAAWLVLVA